MSSLYCVYAFGQSSIVSCELKSSTRLGVEKCKGIFVGFQNDKQCHGFLKQLQIHT